MLEVEESQQALRASIAETQRLMDATEEMLKRHRREREHHDIEAVQDGKRPFST